MNYLTLNKHIRSRSDLTIYLSLLLLVLSDKLNTFFRFSVIYTDSDQTLLWHVAKDIMNGSFHGPCFYGQSYNPVFESLFAIPLLYAGINFNVGLPMVTTIMGMTPFLLLSVYFYKNINHIAGFLPLIVLLLLPPEYSMLTSMSRGFVTGIFFFVPGFVFFTFHKSFFAKFSGGVLLGIALYANLNSILLFPLLIPFLLSGKKEFFNSLKTAFPGFLIGLSSFLFNAAYYKLHPGMLIHDPLEIIISFSSFLSVLGRMDTYFDFVTPVVWRVGWISLLIFVIAGRRLWKYKRKNEFLTVLLLICLIIFSFSVSKVSDATNSVFFSGSRMYIAYPIILIFIFIYLMNTFSDSLNKKILNILILLCLVSLPVKVLAFNVFIKNNLKGSKNSIVRVVKVEKLKDTCKSMLSFADGNLDLVIANSSDTPEQPVTYGCPCLFPDFPPTIQPLYERRTWIVPGISKGTYSRILIHGKDTSRWKKIPDLKILKSDKEQGWLLIENTDTTGRLFHQTKRKIINKNNTKRKV